LPFSPDPGNRQRDRGHNGRAAVSILKEIARTPQDHRRRPRLGICKTGRRNL